MLTSVSRKRSCFACDAVLKKFSPVLLSGSSAEIIHVS